MSPFDFVNAINSSSKKDLIAEDPELEKLYVPFMVNRALSYFSDTVMYANEVNRYSQIDYKLQNSYLLNIVRPAKRFAKWVKKQDNNDIDVVMEYFGYSHEKAIQALSILSSEQLTTIKNKLAKGGTYERDRQPSGSNTS
ncbi:MAG: DNA polymerase [Caulobacteraceae bacterium]|nr:DNA polymerase [Caulobacteraceae bacterium]NDG30728.1 DNA polymerase [bacterium]